jgi:hypothetical protein
MPRKVARQMTNDQQGSSSNHIHNVTAAFLQLREDTIVEARRDYERARYLHSLHRTEREEQAEEARRLLARTGLDLEHVDRFEVSEDRLLHAFLEEVRPHLAERPLALEAHLQARIARARRYHPGGYTPTLLGADVSAIGARDRELRDVWLNDGQVHNVTSSQSGSGWGCFVGENPDYPDPTARWWYSWTPPEDGLYSFGVELRYSGFCIIRADDTWHNCKYAKAIAWTRANVHQYFWLGEHGQRMIDRHGKNIQDSLLVEGRTSFGFEEALNGGDEIIVRVTVTLDTYAQGGGSYAELNFSDGEANLLEAPLVIITKRE